ncbi:unnamed protein product [Amoebophrya sp. A120]|nr:unnamed protein product [Amoebophrya sp. A120]|eukprot:GSA120T00005752001.1
MVDLSATMVKTMAASFPRSSRRPPNKLNVLVRRPGRACGTLCIFLFSCCSCLLRAVPTAGNVAATQTGADEQKGGDDLSTIEDLHFSGGESSPRFSEDDLDDEGPQGNQPPLENTQAMPAASSRGDTATGASSSTVTAGAGPREGMRAHQKPLEAPLVLSVETSPDGQTTQLSSFFAQQGGRTESNEKENGHKTYGGRRLPGRDGDELGPLLPTPGNSTNSVVHLAATTTVSSGASTEESGKKLTWLQLMSGSGRSRGGRSTSSRSSTGRKSRRLHQQGAEASDEGDEEARPSSVRPSETWIDFFADGMGAVALRQLSRGLIDVAGGGTSGEEGFLRSREIKTPLRLLTQSLTEAVSRSDGVMAALSVDTGNVNRFLGSDLLLLRPEGAVVFVQVIFRPDTHASGLHEQTAGGTPTSAAAPIELAPHFAELQGPLQTALQGQVGKVLKSDIRNQKLTRQVSLPVHFASPVTVKLPGKTQGSLQEQRFQINLQHLFPLPQTGDLVTFLIPVFSSSNSASPIMFSPGSVSAVTAVRYHVVSTNEKAANTARNKQQQQTFAGPEQITRGKKVARIALEAMPVENFLGLRGPQAYAPRIMLEDVAADSLRLLPPGTANPITPGQHQDYTQPQAQTSAPRATSSGGAFGARFGGFRVFASAGSSKQPGKKKKRAGGQLRVYRFFYDRARFARTLAPGGAAAAVSTERLHSVRLEEDYEFYRLLHFALKNLARLVRTFLESSQLLIPKKLLREYDNKKATSSGRVPASSDESSAGRSTSQRSSSKTDSKDTKREIRAQLGKRFTRYLEGLTKQILQATFAAFADDKSAAVKIQRADFAPPLHNGTQLLSLFPKLTDHILSVTENKLLLFPLQDSFLLMPKMHGFGFFAGVGGGGQSPTSTTYLGRGKAAASRMSDMLDMFGEMLGTPEDADVPDQAPVRFLLPIAKRVAQGIDFQHFASADVRSNYLLGVVGRARAPRAETQEKDGAEPVTTSARTTKRSFVQFLQGDRREQKQQTETSIMSQKKTRTRRPRGRKKTSRNVASGGSADALASQPASANATSAASAPAVSVPDVFPNVMASLPEAQLSGIVVGLLLLLQGALSISRRKVKEEHQNRNRNVGGASPPTTTTMAELIYYAPIVGGGGADSFAQSLFAKDGDATGSSRSRAGKDSGLDWSTVQSFVNVLPVLQVEWGRVLASGKRYLNPAEEKKEEGVPAVSSRSTERAPGRKRVASFFQILSRQKQGPPRRMESRSHIRDSASTLDSSRETAPAQPERERKGDAYLIDWLRGGRSRRQSEQPIVGALVRAQQPTSSEKVLRTELPTQKTRTKPSRSRDIKPKLSTGSLAPRKTTKCCSNIKMECCRNMQCSCLGKMKDCRQLMNTCRCSCCTSYSLCKVIELSVLFVIFLFFLGLFVIGLFVILDLLSPSGELGWLVVPIGANLPQWVVILAAGFCMIVFFGLLIRRCEGAGYCIAQ